MLYGITESMFNDYHFNVCPECEMLAKAPRRGICLHIPAWLPTLLGQLPKPCPAGQTGQPGLLAWPGHADNPAINFGVGIRLCKDDIMF